MGPSPSTLAELRLDDPLILFAGDKCGSLPFFSFFFFFFFFFFFCCCFP